MPINPLLLATDALLPEAPSAPPTINHLDFSSSPQIFEPTESTTIEKALDERPLLEHGTTTTVHHLRAPTDMIRPDSDYDKAKMINTGFLPPAENIAP